MARYKIADVVFDAKPIYAYTARLCKPYRYDGEEQPEFSIALTEADIAAERAKAPDYPDYYLECLALFRRLGEHLLLNGNGMVFHCSALAVDGNAYLFTAPSGTGKSTHARLWRELLGDKVVMINDDKPVVRYIDGEFYVYGTPWDGKHRLSTNTRARIKGVCAIAQAKENSIATLSPAQMLVYVLNQTMSPKSAAEADKLFALLDRLLKSVDLYKLDCNTDIAAAKLAYSVMVGEKNED